MFTYFIASAVQNILKPVVYSLGTKSASAVIIPPLFGQSSRFTQSVTVAPWSPQDGGSVIQAKVRMPRSTYC